MDLPYPTAPWGRGTGEGIGLSGHKNEFRAGVRIGNWVEEMCGKEAIGRGDTLKDFMKRQEIVEHNMANAANAGELAKSMRVEPKTGVEGDMLFSHGKTFSDKFGASMTALHFSHPSQREYGAASDDRVHKSFFYGSKHIDQYVPKAEPNPRLLLTGMKEAQWAQQMAPQRPTNADMYQTTNHAMFPAMK